MMIVANFFSFLFSFRNYIKQRMGIWRGASIFAGKVLQNGVKNKLICENPVA